MIILTCNLVIILSNGVEEDLGVLIAPLSGQSVFFLQSLFPITTIIENNKPQKKH